MIEYRNIVQKEITECNERYSIANVDAEAKKRIEEIREAIRAKILSQSLPQNSLSSTTLQNDLAEARTQLAESLRRQEDLKAANGKLRAEQEEMKSIPPCV